MTVLVELNADRLMTIATILAALGAGTYIGAS